MAEALAALGEDQLKKLLLTVVSWRLGDVPGLPGTVSETLSLTIPQSTGFLEILCVALDQSVNPAKTTVQDVYNHLPGSLPAAERKKLSVVAFSLREDLRSLCLNHVPTLARVVYHDWRLDTHVATESLGRIARPVASVTLRVQPPASGKSLLPPLESITLELGKDMVDGLSSGFGRLQAQIAKVIKG
jgi:hypothetical protein